MFSRFDDSNKDGYRHFVSNTSLFASLFLQVCIEISFLIPLFLPLFFLQVCKLQRVRCIQPDCPDLYALPRPVCVTENENVKRARIYNSLGGKEIFYIFIFLYLNIQ